MATSGRPLGSMIIELGLEDTKFEQSLTSLRKQFDLAKSAMKANVATLSSTEDAYQQASGKVDSLTQVMAANERQIKKLKSDYDDAVRVNGKYSDSAVNIGKKINIAEKQQADFSRQLTNAKSAMKDAANGTEEYQAALERTKKQISSTDDLLKTQGKTTEANLVQYRSLSTEIQQYDDVINAEKKRLDDLRATKGDDAEATKDQELKINELTDSQKKAQYEHDELGKSVKHLSDNQAQAIDVTNRFSGKISEAGSKIQGVGQKMTTGFTTPIVAGLGYATSSAISFDSQIQKIGPLLSDNGKITANVKKQLHEMSDESKNWATQYGISTTKINAGMEEIIKRGYSAEQTMGAMPSILDASVASGDDFNTVMTVSTSTLEQFGLKSNTTAGMLKNTQRVTDSLTYTANATAAGFQDMGDAMTYVGPTAHAAGISLEQTAAAIGLMSNQGIEGSNAGTALRSALTRLMKPTKQNIQGFQELGVNVSAFKNHSLTLPQLLNQIKNNTAGWTKEQRAAAIAMAFGTEAQAGMNALVSQGGDALQDLTTKTENAGGTTKKIAAEMNNTSKANMNQFKESLKVLATSIGEELIPHLTSAAKSLTSFVKEFSKLSGPTKAFAITVAAITAALGPLLMIIGSVARGVSALSAAFAFFASNPVALAIAAIVLGIAALATGLIEAYKHIKPFHDAVNALFKTLKDVFTKVVNWFKELPTNFNNAVAGINKWMSGLSQNFNNGISGIKKWFGDIGSKIGNAWNTVKSGFNKWITGAGQVGKQILNAILNALKGFGKAVVYTLAFPVGLAVIMTRPLVKPLQNIIQNLINWIKSIWNPFINWFKNTWKTVAIFWKNTWNRLVNWFKGILNNISQIFHTVFGTLTGWFRGAVNGIAQIWRNVWSGISNFIHPILGGISDFIINTINGIRNIWNNVWSAVSQFFSNIWNGMVSFVQPILNSISSFISSALSAINTTWQNMWNGMSSFFSQIWNGIKNAAQDGINGVINVINAGVDAIDTVWKFFTGKKTNVAHLKPVHFEQGGIVQQHLSVINDGIGQDWKELVELPSGQLMMSQQKNWTGFLPEGTRVYSGEETKNIMSLAGIEHYANGGIVGATQGLINWAGQSLDNIGSFLGDKFEAIMKFMDHPIENTKNLMKSAAQKFMPTVQAYADLAAGALDKTSDGVAKWVKEHLQKYLDQFGGGNYNPEMIRAAAAMMKVHPSDAFIHMLQATIQSESGGRNIIQQIHDINSGGNEARGILQYTPPTFRYYAMPGHTNIMNPFDQLLAFFNNSDWEHSIGPTTIWGVSKIDWLHSGPQGHRRFADGGFVSQPTYSLIGEAGTEAVVPLTNQTKAMQILARIKDQYGLTAGGDILFDTKGIEDKQTQEIQLLKEQNNVLYKIFQLVANIGNHGNNDTNAMNELANWLDSQGLKNRKVAKFQS